MPPAVQLEEDTPGEAEAAFEARDVGAEVDVDVPEEVGEEGGRC